MWEGLAGAFPAKLDYPYFLAKTHRVLAQAQARLNATPAEVLGHINAAVEIDEELVNQRTANGVFRSALADSLLLASVQHRRLGDVKTTRGLVDRALELRLLAVEGDPQNPMLRRELADVFYHSAVAAFSERLADGNFEAVHEACDRAIALYSTLSLARLLGTDDQQPSCALLPHVWESGDCYWR